MSDYTLFFGIAALLYGVLEIVYRVGIERGRKEGSREAFFAGRKW